MSYHCDSGTKKTWNCGCGRGCNQAKTVEASTWGKQAQQGTELLVRIEVHRQAFGLSCPCIIRFPTFENKDRVFTAIWKKRRKQDGLDPNVGIFGYGQVVVGKKRDICPAKLPCRCHIYFSHHLGHGQRRIIHCKRTWTHREPSLLCLQPSALCGRPEAVCNKLTDVPQLEDRSVVISWSK
jgi:hypothetical protein